METADYVSLEKRIGRKHLADRLLKQAGNSAKLVHQGEGIFRLERMIPVDDIVAFLLRCSGFGGMARRNFLDVRVVTQEWHLPHLPQAFDGFRLMQIADLHLDLDPALWPVVEKIVASSPHDAVVLTGDYRNRTHSDYAPCLREMSRIVSGFASPRWGILGNHDCIEMVPALERDGLPILLNETASLERDGERLWIAGVDDPHFYKTHDLEKTRRGIPEGACVILLSHTPEIYADAEPLGFDLMLSGHTHGGQICLPGGIPVVVSCRAPRAFIKGRWKHGNLQGYTSAGTGCCAVAARLNCPAEITMHVLCRGNPR